MSKEIKNILDKLEKILNDPQNWDYDSFGTMTKMVYKTVIKKFIKKQREDKK